MPDTAQANTASAAVPSQIVSTPIIKLLIGFIAGLCACVLPRITALMAVGSDSVAHLVDPNYFKLSLGFALLVGLTVMILEWRVPREPRATFMLAIGIPALITGSYNTSYGIGEAASQNKDMQAKVEELQNSLNIPTLPALREGFTRLNTNTVKPGHDQQSRVWLQWLGIKDAKAEESAVTQAHFAGVIATGITFNEPMFYIVLAQVSSKQDALNKAKTLKSQIHGVVAVRSGKRYLILYSDKPMKRTDAVLKTVDLQKKYHLSPQLLTAK